MNRAAVLAAVIEPDPVAPPGSGGFQTMLNWVNWGMLGAAVLGVMIVAGKLFINHRRGEAGQELGGLGWIGVGLFLLGAAGGIVGQLA